MKKALSVLLIGIFALTSVAVSTGIVYAQSQSGTTQPNTANPSSTGAGTGTGGAQNTDEFVPLAPIPGLTDQQTITNELNDTSNSSFANFFNNLYKYLIGLAAILAVMEIMIGGFQISLQQTNISKQLEARGRITRAILGLIIVLAPVMVFSIINKSILNLSVDLPTLNTAAPINSSSQTTIPTSSGCSSSAGPSQGTVLATCGAVSSSQTAGDAVSIANKEAQDFIKNNCSDDKTEQGAAFPAKCLSQNKTVTSTASGGTVTSSCATASAVAYCSPIVTADIVQSVQYNGAMAYAYAQTVEELFTDLGWFGQNVPFVQSCTTNNWKLQRAGGVDLIAFNVSSPTQEGTKIDCPSNNPDYQKIISSQDSGTQFECVSVPVYCEYTP